MNQNIKILFHEIETGTSEEKYNNLLLIGDYVEFGYSRSEDLCEAIQKLIELAAQETDLKARALMFRNISVGYTQRADFTEIKFDPIIDILEEKDPNFICNALYLLSATYKKKYIPVVSKYLSHPDEKIREEAQSALLFFPEVN